MDYHKIGKKNIIAPLMMEHRVIERMVRLIQGEIDRIGQTKRVDAEFVDTSADFFREFADRCHHGKEEDILFRELAKRKLSSEHRRIMDELIAEHKLGRSRVKALREAKERYAQGESGALGEIIELLKTLVDFYPRHIEKEDKHFFLPVMRYFSKAELQEMFEQGEEFERSMPHAEYEQIVERLVAERG